MKTSQISILAMEKLSNIVSSNFLNKKEIKVNLKYVY